MSLIFTPIPGEIRSNLTRTYFSAGLVQPTTRNCQVYTFGCPEFRIIQVTLEIPTWNNVSLPGGHCYYPNIHIPKNAGWEIPMFNRNISTHRLIHVRPLNVLFRRGIFFRFVGGNSGMWAPAVHMQPRNRPTWDVSLSADETIALSLNRNGRKLKKVPAAQWVKRCVEIASKWQADRFGVFECRKVNSEGQFIDLFLLGCKNSYYIGWTESR